MASSSLLLLPVLALTLTLPLRAHARHNIQGQAASASGPRFSVHRNSCACNALFKEGGKAPWGQSTADLQFLGTASSMAACNDQAAAWTTSNINDIPSSLSRRARGGRTARCLSACWFHTPWNSTYTNQCYCRSEPTWMPLPGNQADSSVLEWPCEGPADCSYNGECTAAGAGTAPGCMCAPAWGGVRCGELQLLPADRKAPGFREVDAETGANTSTWGAPVLYDEKSDGWHGWASEITHGCGINAWESNSQIVHIVGEGPLGPFTRKGVFAPPFAHEPDVVRGPKGEWVMTYSAYNRETRALGLRGYNASTLAAAACTNCSQGASPPQGSPGCPFQRGTPKSLSHPMIQMLAIADSPDGPWVQKEIHGLTAGWDWNTALTINADGSAVALIRGGMTWHASSYADNSTWNAVGKNISGTMEPQGPQWPTGVEDPYIWTDARGVYHALAHAFTPFYGVHAYVRPEDVPTNFTDPNMEMHWTLSGVAYGNEVNFTDGTSFAFSRRERPHLTWAKGKHGVTPVALTNGVEYGKRANTAGQDTIYTLMQPLHQA